MESSTASHRYYRPELDVVRFIAFLMVFITHSWPGSGDPRLAFLPKSLSASLIAFDGAGRFGLSLFFTLSSFLICELLLRERALTGTISVSGFYVRRTLRIWPLYYLALTAGLIAAYLPGSIRAEIPILLWFYVFLGSWSTEFVGGLTNPANPLWSVSVEEQFYLFAPWIAKYFSRKQLAFFCLFLILLANGVLLFFGITYDRPHGIWRNSFVQFECFAAGILLCLALKGQTPRLSLPARVGLMSIAEISWLVAQSMLHDHVTANASTASIRLILTYALASFGSVVLLLAFLGIDANYIPRWAIHLGRISYGLYVYHAFSLFVWHFFPIGHWISLRVKNHFLRASLSGGMTVILTLGLTVILAEISYRYFETPFLRRKQKYTVIANQPIKEHSEREAEKLITA